MSKRDNGDGHVWEDKTRGVYRAALPVPGRSKPKYLSAPTKRKLNAIIKAEKAKASPSGYTVASAATEWLRDHIKPTCRKSTYDQYESLVRVHILPVVGSLPVEDVRPKDVQRIVVAMSDKSIRTRRHAHNAIRALYNWMALNGMVEKSPVVGIKLPEIGNTTRRSLDSKEIPALLDAMVDSRWRLSVQFLLLTGLRRGELLALKWSDIADGWINISRTLSKGGIEGPPKSRAGNRSLRIGKAVEAILNAQKVACIAEGIRSQYVFPSHTGKPIRPDTYLQTIRNFARKVGIDITIHELRHTFVSISGRGMDLKSLQAVLGHTSSTMTLDIYRHILDGDMDRAADVIDSTAAGLGLVPLPILRQTAP